MSIRPALGAGGRASDASSASPFLRFVGKAARSLTQTWRLAKIHQARWFSTTQSSFLCDKLKRLNRLPFGRERAQPTLWRSKEDEKRTMWRA